MDRVLLDKAREILTTKQYSGSFYFLDDEGGPTVPEKATSLSLAGAIFLACGAHRANPVDPGFVEGEALQAQVGRYVPEAYHSLHDGRSNLTRWEYCVRPSKDQALAVLDKAIAGLTTN